VRNEYRRRAPTCRNCGHDRFYVDRERVERVSCICEGAHHWGAHRAGSTYCEKNPNVWFNRAKRAGATPEMLADLRVDLALAGITLGQAYPPHVVPF
jgi:hypothetical protein